MPRKKANTRSQYNFKGFVECNLDKAMKDDFRKIPFSPAGLWDELERLVDGDMAVKISPDYRGGGKSVFLSYTDPKHPMHGYMLSARAGDVLTAVCVLLYKHYNVLDGNWETEVNRDFEGDDIA